MNAALTVSCADKSLPSVSYGLLYLIFTGLSYFLLYCTFIFPSPTPPQLSLNSLPAVHQDSTLLLKGVVVDRSTNQPIPFAHVAVTGRAAVQVQADGNGSFAIPVRLTSQNRSLTVSSLGYTVGEFSIPNLLKQPNNSSVKLLLSPKYMELSEVEIKARAKKWKISHVGYNIDEGSPFKHAFAPSDTLKAGAVGQEIGTRIQLRKYPAHLRSFSFGLLGTGADKVTVRLRLYSLQNDLPHQNLLSEIIEAQIPPHCTGWVTVDVDKYDITLKEDVVLAIEWLNEANKLTPNSLITYASIPKDQATFYRDSPQASWRRLKETSIGMYVTVLHEK